MVLSAFFPERAHPVQLKKKRFVCTFFPRKRNPYFFLFFRHHSLNELFWLSVPIHPLRGVGDNPQDVGYGLAPAQEAAQRRRCEGRLSGPALSPVLLLLLLLLIRVSEMILLLEETSEPPAAGGCRGQQRHYDQPGHSWGQEVEEVLWDMDENIVCIEDSGVDCVGVNVHTLAGEQCRGQGLGQAHEGEHTHQRQGRGHWSRKNHCLSWVDTICIVVLLLEIGHFWSPGELTIDWLC